MRTIVFTAVALGFGALAPFACTDKVDHVTPPHDGGTGGSDSGGGGDGGPTRTVTQKGQIIQLGSTSTGVPSPKVDPTVAGAVTGDAKGNYTMPVPADTPFDMMISADTYTTVIEQEWKLSGDYDRKTTSLPDSNTTQALLTLLQGIDVTKGVLSVGLVKTGACPDEGGATIALDPPGDSKVEYFKNGFPSSSQTTTVAGQVTPTAILYNLEPGNTFAIKVTHPSCTQQPFPYTPPAEPAITYTGNVRVDPANPPGAPAPKTSFIRIFISK